MRRGFIFAVENYAQMTEGLARQLPGTLAAALSFRKWLLDDHRVLPEHVYLCTDDPAAEGRTAGAARDDVVQELLRLKTEGKDKTEELYVFFSGHGFCYTDVDGARLADVLIAADYRNRDDSGNACLKLDEIQKWLMMCLGPQDHYYFIDACRNSVSERDIKVGTLGLRFDLSRLGVPTVYTLSSTTQGTTAAVGSGFPEVLMEGLSGRGRAKTWQGAKMAVLFASLKEYVEQRLTGQPVDERKEGRGKGVIREIDPPPRFSCSITVEHAEPQDAFRGTITTARGLPAATFTFTGSSHQSDPLVPDDYLVSIDPVRPGSVVELLDTMPADLYEACTLRFEQRATAAAAPAAAPAGPAPTAGPTLESTEAGPMPPSWELPSIPPPPSPVFRPTPVSTLTVRGPRGARVVVEDLTHGDVEVNTFGTSTIQIAPGRYAIRVVEHEVTVARSEVQIAPGGHSVLDLAQFQVSPLRTALLSAVPGGHGDGAVQFSETLGDTTDQGLDLWLAILGAARIVGGKHNGFYDFSKLGPLPLQSFDDQTPGGAAVYLLAGFDRDVIRLAAAISDKPGRHFTDVAPHPSLPGLFELAVRDLPEGHHFVSVEIAGNAPVTFGTCALKNRVTLVTATHDVHGGLAVQQFILPLAHLEHLQPLGIPPVAERLRAVRRMVQVQRAFAAGEELRALLTAGELDEILFLKWIDPMVAVLAAYELVRRASGQNLPMAVGNLRQYFGAIPDVQALAKLAGLPWTMPERPPLVLEGYMALDLMRDRNAAFASMTDFRGPWSAWRPGAP